MIKSKSYTGEYVAKQVYGAHATVICGINIIAGYITIMNPASGFQSVSSDGRIYSYISLTDNSKYELNSYGN